MPLNKLYLYRPAVLYSLLFSTARSVLGLIKVGKWKTAKTNDLLDWIR